MAPRERLENKVVDGTLIENIILLKKKEINKKYNGRPVAEEYIWTEKGLKYVSVFKSGSLNVVSNVLPKACYDYRLKPETIIEMFKRRINPEYSR
ncbi:MAG: hypothetical protein ABIG69_19335 [Bacteroidota bacterium]